jgi:hypothetical protein
VCASGVTIARPVLKLRAQPFLARFRGEALLGTVDPPVTGVRVVVDDTTGGGEIDVTIPGGPNWTENAKRTRWRWEDPSGTLGGITGVLVRNKSRAQPGLVRWVVKGRSPAPVGLPDVAAVRTTIVMGAACAARVWNQPGAVRPRCDGDAARIVCR